MIADIVAIRHSKIYWNFYYVYKTRVYSMAALHDEWRNRPLFF